MEEHERQKPAEGASHKTATVAVGEGGAGEPDVAAHRDDPPKPWWWDHEKWRTIATGVAAVAAITALALNYAALRNAQRLAIAAQRAYVQVTAVHAERRAVVQIDIRNTGHTPAPRYSIAGTEIRSIRNGPCIGGGQFSIDSRAPVFPDAVAAHAATHPFIDYGEREDADLASETELITIMGWVEYRTGFKSTDSYPFCWFYAARPRPTWSLCPEVAEKKR
jgi:hypothetical protein